MKTQLYFFIILFAHSFPLKPKTTTNKTIADVKKSLETYEKTLSETSKRKIVPIQITNVTQVKIVPPTAPKRVNFTPKMIPPTLIQEWAEKIYEGLHKNEKQVVRASELLKGFHDIKSELRNGTEIVNKVAESLEELLTRRARAAENIMRKAEQLARDSKPAPPSFSFYDSVELNQMKKYVDRRDLGDYELPMNCTSVNKVQLTNSKHFDAPISLNISSVYVAAEIFNCAPHVLNHIYWSRELLSIFKHNYGQDATTEFQYFCSSKGFLRHYPAALWSRMYKLDFNTDDVYDCRLRPWYVSAAGAPRDVLILLDASGSMTNSSNKVIGEEFILALLSALTDDDHVNVLRFNVDIQSPITCFNEKLVSANHVNSAAMMAAMKFHKMVNETHMHYVLEYAVRLLQKQQVKKERPPACQQAIVLLTDSMYANYSALMRHLDPHNKIRLFTLWLHDRYGLRDNTREYGDWLSCDRDGYFAELITNNDVTEQVIKILQVLERPLVAQRKERLRVFSDVYAHVEDPRRSEYFWRQKENAEQAYRYNELRINKQRLLSPNQMYKDYMHQVNLDKYGYYYEGQDLNYRLEISVAVPVFDSTYSENITKQLEEEKQRNSTRTYPVNRLLGVAGIDIPLDHLKLVLPYHQLGAGGSLFIVDHRGNIVLHDNVKPTFDGVILKPGYRTVDFLDLEQAAVRHFPRHYPPEWLQFRKTLIIDKKQGNATMYSKDIFEGGMRAIIGLREYHWRRVLDQYTVIIVLPMYGRHHVVPETAFTKQLAEEAWKSLSKTDYAVHPDWLYCRHVDPHFDSREAEVRHFIRRRSDESNFKIRNLKHLFSPIPPALLEKTYQCDAELMAKFCKEVIATDKWAKEHEEPDTDRDCSTCELGSTTAFFASENGLTRWQQYHATSFHADPPDGSWWAHGPSEPWYRRAASEPNTLIIHSPVLPIRKMRNTYIKPPPLDEKFKWLTAARTLVSSDAGIIGVAGYHFYPAHLVDLLNSVTNFPCNEDDEDKCDPRCDGIIWSCLLVDEGGWVVARDRPEGSVSEDEEVVNEHLSILYPGVMATLLNASVFELNWLHDYQSVCFPPKDEKPNSASMMPSLLKSLWNSIHLIVRITQEMATLLVLISSGISVSADTAKEKQKRRNRLQHDYERELYERLYDDRVIVNRTRFAACDRSRPLYVLQRTSKATEMLKRPPKPCRWPLVGAFVPNTNLLLLAIFNNCSYTGRPVPNPLNNEQYLEVDTNMESIYDTSATRLACWRNRETLPTRTSHTQCYPHNYSQEEGYRQCGPWLPNPETEDGCTRHLVSRRLLASIFIIILSSIIV